MGSEDLKKEIYGYRINSDGEKVKITSKVVLRKQRERLGIKEWQVEVGQIVEPKVKIGSKEWSEKYGSYYAALILFLSVGGLILLITGEHGWGPIISILGVLAIIGIIWVLFFSGDGSGYDGPDDGFEDFDDDY